MTTGDASTSGDELPEDRNFVRAMRMLRRERRWSQADMAEALQKQGWPRVRQAMVSRIEKGDRVVGLGEAHRIARVLGTTVEAMAAPDSIFLVTTRIHTNLERIERQVEAVDEAVILLQRWEDHMRRDLAQARDLLEDDPDETYHAVVEAAVEVGERALREAMSRSGDGERPENIK